MVAIDRHDRLLESRRETHSQELHNRLGDGASDVLQFRVDSTTTFTAITKTAMASSRTVP